jgi:hypothetical protein
MITHPLPSRGELRPFGLLLHTTGDGLAKKCLAEDAVKATCETYAGMKEGPHYAVVPDGRLIKFRSPDTVSWHAGVSAHDRASYLNGSWESDGKIPSAVIKWWKLRWLGKKSPQHLYPERSPNASYVGIEMIPCGVYNKNTWDAVLGTPATPTGRYTAEQYMQVALLATALAKAYNWPDGWAEGPRLLGHEDVNPYTRPGWDPGAYHGWFSWSLMRGLIRGLMAGGIVGKEM